jgi:hypothetical protein
MSRPRLLRHPAPDTQATRLRQAGAKTYHDLMRLPDPLSRADVARLLGELLAAVGGER